MEFILILSPKSAPPVFFLEGSTEMIAIFLSGLERRNRRTNSSVNEDFPAPPVPVIPMMGILAFFAFSSMALTKSSFFSEKFSTAEMTCAMDFESSKEILSRSETVTFSPVAKSDFSTKLSIIPCKPSALPSSGE
ncbi:hypothetical protein SDC9_173577 [bioreactor metagenome]|uniref:Uncharacterized protein n=1 Tax=bioreactor metagenome TaxID=1076179 RepID=A0A645GR50_9ZZZZ